MAGWVRAATIVLVAFVLCEPAAAQDTALRARPSAATPADSALEVRAAAIAATLRCPVCQGESIQESPSELAQNMRAVVRDQLRAGKTPEEVKAYFVSKYGEWILLEPAMTGLNVALWVFPVLLVIGGLALVAVLVRRWSGPNDVVPSGGTEGATVEESRPSR